MQVQGFWPRPSHLLVIEDYQYDAHASFQLRSPAPEHLPFDRNEFSWHFARTTSPSRFSELTSQKGWIPLSHDGLQYFERFQEMPMRAAYPPTGNPDGPNPHSGLM
jgi:hypothetical protein